MYIKLQCMICPKISLIHIMLNKLNVICLITCTLKVRMAKAAILISDHSQAMSTISQELANVSTRKMV